MEAQIKNEESRDLKSKIGKLSQDFRFLQKENASMAQELKSNMKWFFIRHVLRNKFLLILTWNIWRQANIFWRLKPITPASEMSRWAEELIVWRTPRIVTPRTAVCRGLQVYFSVGGDRSVSWRTGVSCPGRGPPWHTSPEWSLSPGHTHTTCFS